MIGRTRTRARTLAVATAVCALSALGAASASATPEIVYNNLPAAPLPSNVTSLGYEATQTSQLGGSVELGGVKRVGGSVLVGMSIWACEKGSWTGTPECHTEPGATFEVPMTLRVYHEEPSGEPGSLVTETMKVQRMPYRPTETRLKCVNKKGEPEGGYYRKGVCYHGKYVQIMFPVGKITWPNKVIISVSYNTSDYGPVPQRPQPCNSESGGCPYDSLNVGLAETGPSVGTDPQPNDAYQDSLTPGNWCDNGAGGTGVFRLDAGCWAPYQPFLQVRANL